MFYQYRQSCYSHNRKYCNIILFCVYKKKRVLYFKNNYPQNPKNKRTSPSGPCSLTDVKNTKNINYQ